MASESTGQNETAAIDTLEQLIDGGLTIHLLETALEYGDGDTEVNNKSVNQESIAEADLLTQDGGGFDGTAEIVIDRDLEFDVTANEEQVFEVALQNQNNPDRVFLADELNDPLLSELDTYTIEDGTTLYELGNPEE